MIDKPPNLPVHPAGRYFFNTLLTHLKTQGHKNPLQRRDSNIISFTASTRKPAEFSSSAKRRKRARISRRSSRPARPRRLYLAIAKGITPPEFEVDLAMKRSTNSAISLKMMIAPESEGGQTALTRFKRLSVHRHPSHGEFLRASSAFRRRGASIRSVFISRPRDIPSWATSSTACPRARLFVSMNALRLTPEAEARLIIPSHALHAAEIRFEHPVSGKMMQFASPLPADLQAFLSECTSISDC